MAKEFRIEYPNQPERKCSLLYDNQVDYDVTEYGVIIIKDLQTSKVLMIITEPCTIEKMD